MARDKLDDCPCREGAEGPLEHCPAHGNPRYFAELLEDAERRIADLQATNTQRSYIIDGQDRDLVMLRRWKREAVEELKEADRQIEYLEAENVALMAENSRLMVAAWEGETPKKTPVEGPSLTGHLDIT